MDTTPLAAVFSELFYVPNDLTVRNVLLSVTSDKFQVLDTTSETQFDLEDIIGVSVEQFRSIRMKQSMPFEECDDNNSEDLLYALKIYFDNTPRFLSNINKKSLEYTCYTGNLKLANTWRNVILNAAFNPLFKENAASYAQPEDLPIYIKNLLVFINPKSGKGASLEVWKKAKISLERAGCTFTEVLTQHAQHAKEYIFKRDAAELKKFNGIVTVSGDGLPHEVINGIMSRPDWEEIREIPIGSLPSGSGNAIVQCLLAKAKRKNTLEDACYLIAKGKTLRSDLTKIERGDGQAVYSFLHFLWGIISYVDFESEKCRFLGGLRFELYGALGVLKNTKYRAKITYSTTTTDLPALNQEIEGDEWKSLTDEFSYFNIHNLPYMAKDTLAAPLADFDDGYNHFLALAGDKCTRKQMLKAWSHLYGTLFENDKPKPETGLFFEKLKSFRVEPLGEFAGQHYSIDGEKYNVEKVQGKVIEKAIKFFSA